MTIQYIQDITGATSGVIVPIEEWNRITERYSDLEEIPDWQKRLLDTRLDEYIKHPEKIITLKEFFQQMEGE